MAQQVQNQNPLIQETVNAMRARPRFAHLTDEQLAQTCATLTDRLQRCDLTINFHAAGFFKAKNTTVSYQQMYERTGLVYARAMLGGATTPKAAYNRDTKRVFAALNYGRNPHGPALRYGMSHFVLNKNFKANALYYAGNTFLKEAEHICSTTDHLSFDSLGALYGMADKKNHVLRDALEAACFDRQSLPDNVPLSGEQIIEAHLSDPLMFAGGLEAIYLSPKPIPEVDKVRQGPSLYGKAWTDVQDNARDFAWKFGAELFILSE